VSFVSKDAILSGLPSIGCPVMIVKYW
jgi:hypothetical protein